MSKFKSIAIKGARSAALGLFLAYAGCCVLMWFAQGHLIFRPNPGSDSDPSERGWAFEDLRLPVLGHETQGWYVPLETHRGVVLFSHGNGDTLSGCLGSIGLLRGFGFSVLAYDYGGYGNSTGTASEKRCNADIRAMWDYLVREKGIAPKDILLFGRSLGGGPTADLAKDVTPGAIILESTFLSTMDMGRDMPLYRPWLWLLRHKFSTKDKVSQFTAPLLILHSREDEIVPYKHGLALFERAHEPKRFVELHGGHNDGYHLSEAAYRAGWEAFLAPIFGENPASPDPAGENTSPDAPATRSVP